jgi:thioredoxin-like negative regulator of GroEL
MTPLTFSQFDEEVQNYPGSVILFFTATWATPAIKTRNFLQSSNLNIQIYSVDYDTERELVDKYSVRDIPIVYFIVNGVVQNFAYSVENENDLKVLIS